MAARYDDMEPLRGTTSAVANRARKMALIKTSLTALVGAAGVGLGAGGLVWFIQSDWFHDPGPYPYNSWAGYTPAQFTGLAFFNMFSVAGYVMLYVGITTGARITEESDSVWAEALWLGLQGALALTSVVLGLLGAIYWGGGSFMNCGGVGCVNINKYVEITKPVAVRDSAGDGFLGGLGMTAFFSLVPIGLILCWRTARRIFAPHFFAPRSWLMPAPTDTATIAFRARLRRWVLWITFVVAWLAVFFWAWITFWWPDDWEYFTDARIAQSAQLQIADPSLSVWERWGTLCGDQYQQYTCPELPWAFFHSRSFKLNDNLYLKLFVSNVFFFCYLLGIFAAAFLVTHANARWSKFWSTPMPKPPAWLPAFLRPRFTRGEFVATWVTKWMTFVFFIYWVHDHNFDGMYSPYNTASPAVNWTFLNITNNTAAPAVTANTIGMSNTERWARTMGQMAVLFLSLLMFAASRESVFHKMLGTSWESFLWAHKALGYGMLGATFLHMAFWWRQYDMADIFPSEIFALPPKYGPSIDNFTVPLIFLTTMVLFVAMGIFALEPVRRRFFELFYYTHLFAAWTTIPVTLWHAASGWEYMIPGLTVWLIDRLFRASRSAARVRLLSVKATASHDGDERSNNASKSPTTEQTRTVELKFTVDAWALATARPGQYVFVNVAEISVLEWHPFTLSHVPCPDGRRENNGNYLALHIKSMGKGTWTDRLYEHVLAVSDRDGNVKPGSLSLAVDGPHGHPFEHERYTDVVLFAGGIGITPVACIFDNLKRARVDPAAHGAPDAAFAQALHGGRRLRAVWALREDQLLATDLQMQLATYRGDGDGELVYPDQQAKVHLTRLTSPEMRSLIEGAKATDVDVPCTVAAGRPNVVADLEAALCDPDEPGVPVRAGRTPMVFVCGPEPLVESVVDWCDKKGVAVHRETFLL